MTRPRVFVVNEPLKYDSSIDEHVRFIDLEPAREHGDVVVLLPPGPQAADSSDAIARLRDGLAGYDPVRGDALALVGDLALVAIAAAIAADVGGGRLRVLKWVKARSRYRVVDASITRPTPDDFVPITFKAAGEPR